MAEQEIWRPIKTAPGYEVSNFGRIRSYRTTVFYGQGHVYSTMSDTPHLITPSTATAGYKVWGYRSPTTKKMVQERVHRTVLEAFVGPRPPGMVTRHLDGDPANNRLSNLTWGTNQENRDDRTRHGRNNDGPNNNTSKLTWEQVRQIRASDSTITDLASQYGVTYNTIHRIKHRTTWRHDPND